jgi:hypothetical protein
VIFSFRFRKNQKEISSINLQQSQLEINDTKKLNDMVTWLGGAVKQPILCCTAGWLKTQREVFETISSQFKIKNFRCL